MTARNRTSEHFRTLGVSHDASDAEIQQAYYRLARTHHPDHNYGDPDAEDRFKRIQLAYESLSQRIRVTSPEDFRPFPFVVADSPRSQMSKYLLAVAVSALILPATIYGWAQLNLLDAVQSNQIGVKTGRFGPENHTPAESELTADHFVKNETKQPKTNEGHDLPNHTTDSMVYDEPLLISARPMNLGRPPEARYLASETQAVGSLTAQPLLESLTDMPWEIVKNTLDDRMQVASQSSESQLRAVVGLFSGRTAPNEADSLEESRESSSRRKKRSKKKRKQHAASSTVESIPKDFAKQVSRWEGKIEPLNYLDDELTDLAAKDNHWMRHTESHPLDLTHDAAINTKIPNAKRNRKPTLDLTAMLSSSQRQPISLKTPIVEFASPANPHAQKFSSTDISSTAVQLNTSEKIRSDQRKQTALYSKKDNPLKRNNLSASWESSIALPLQQHHHKSRYNKQRAWSVRDETMFSPMKGSSKRTPYVFSKSLTEQPASEPWGVNSLSTQSFSYEPHLDGSKGLRNVYQPLNADHIAGKSQLGSRNSIRASTENHESSGWTPSSSRLKEYKNVLPPYTSKNVFPNGNRKGSKARMSKTNFNTVRINPW